MKTLLFFIFSISLTLVSAQLPAEYTKEGYDLNGKVKTVKTIYWEGLSSLDNATDDNQSFREEVGFWNTGEVQYERDTYHTITNEILPDGRFLIIHEHIDGSKKEYYITYENGKTLKSEFYWDGETESITYYEYNDAGQVTKTYAENLDTGEKQLSAEYQYNAEGKIIELKTFFDGELFSTVTNTYEGSKMMAWSKSEYGETNKEFLLNENNLVVEEKTENSTMTHSYEFDEQGNWTEKVTSATNANGKPIYNVVKREILYY